MSQAPNIHSKKNSIQVYNVFPFHIIPKTEGELFDTIQSDIFNYGIKESILEIRKILKQLNFPGREKVSIGDFSKYYDFISSHFGQDNDSANFEIFSIDPNRLFPFSSDLGLKNLQLQLSEKDYYLGPSCVKLAKSDNGIISIDTFIFINSIAQLGYIVIGLELESTEQESILEGLSRIEFFRNIGWRKGQKPPKKGTNQYIKYAFSVKGVEENKFIPELSFFEIFTSYFSQLKDFIRFYHNRVITLYIADNILYDSKEEKELQNLFFDVIRVPDINVQRFSHLSSEPAIIKIGRNVICAALNEGAIAVETINEGHDNKSLVKKYIPAFLLAINQRELLLKTMQQVSTLNPEKLLSLENGQLEKVEFLKTSLLVLQLKQIFYSVSNTHEVEVFFTQLQRVFNIEIMLKENEQSISEIYKLLELKKSFEDKKISEARDIIEKEKIEKEEMSAKIVNTILGVIACLGLFSFLKDLLPFLFDSQYFLIYKWFSIFLPFGAGVWLVWYMFGRKNN